MNDATSEKSTTDRDVSEPISVGHELFQGAIELLKGDQRRLPWPLRYVAAWWGSFVVHSSAIVTGLANSPSILEGLPDNLLVPFGFWFLLYVSIFPVISASGISRGSVVRHFLSGVALPALSYGIGAGIISTIGG